MMINLNNYIYIVIGMGLVTYLPRWIPLIVLNERRLPAWLVEWLDLIPVAILSALLLPALTTVGSPRQLDLMRPELFVSIPTLAVALWTRSLGGTVVSGMLLFWLADLIF